MHVNAYGLDDFCGDVRTVIKRDGQAGLAAVAERLQRLLANPAFVAATFDDSMAPGKRVIHHDSETDVYVLAHVNAPSQKPGLPHSHGTSWAVYGNAKGATEMKLWQRVNPESEAHAELTVINEHVLEQGQARPYASGVVHSTNQPGKTWVVRVTGTDLDHLPRYRFNRNTDKMVENATSPAER
jgi:hypothetical protein